MKGRTEHMTKKISTGFFHYKVIMFRNGWTDGYTERWLEPACKVLFQLMSISARNWRKNIKEVEHRKSEWNGGYLCLKYRKMT